MSRKLGDTKFTKVIIDEAAQAQEIEILKAIYHAEQLVLIGDHKQLESIYSVEVPKFDSYSLALKW